MTALAIGGACILASTAARADALVFTRAMTATTIAEIFVGEDVVRMELEIGLPDLPAFRNLLPDEIHDRLGFPARPWPQRVETFFREDLTLRPDGGPPLAGRVEGLEARPRTQRDEITGDPLPVVDDDAELVVFAQLAYPLDRRPAVLRLAPPAAPDARASPSIGFVVYHRGLPVNDFRYLGTTETLRLDWDDPWYSRFENRNLRRRYDSPVSAFLYVEPFEVRKEIVLRPLDLQPWIDLGLDGKETIRADDQAELKRRVAEFLAEHTPLTIDGVPSEGTLDRIHFIRRSLRTTGVIDPPEDLDPISATLGVIFVHPVGGLPEEAALRWELFNDRIQRVPASATDEAGGLPAFLTPDDPELRWQNFLTNPSIPRLVEVGSPPRRALWPALAAAGSALALAALLVAFGRRALSGGVPRLPLGAAIIALAVVLGLSVPRALGTPRLADAEADAVVGNLLRNVYRAFDYRDEEVIYDTLAHSVDGDLLTDIYLETRQSLEIENQGGARARVKEVEIVESRYEPADGGDGFIAHLTWDVSGSVGHWGHIHRRTNRYVARVDVGAIDGAWKVTDLELLQEERLTAPPAAPTQRRPS